MSRTELAGFVLAAGSGTRLRPLTDLRPKALCPVNNVPLGEAALGRALSVTSDVTINAWHHRNQIVEHFEDRARLSVEEQPLGTAGAIGHQKDWIDGRGTLVHNADAWHTMDLQAFAEGWDGERARLLVQEDPVRGDFGSLRFCGVSLLPWTQVSTLKPEPSGLWEVSWRHLFERSEIEFVLYDGPFFDCGTPHDYLSANLVASGADNVVAPDAKVQGSILRCVVWPQATVEPGEHLIDIIRAPGGVTVSGSLSSATS